MNVYSAGIPLCECAFRL